MTRRTILALAAVLTLGSVACKSPTGRQTATTTAEPSTLSQLAAEVGVTFPTSSRLLGVARESGIDDLVMFKVELPRRDLASFLATCPIPADAFAPSPAAFLGPDQGFWDPSRATHLRIGQVMRNTRATNVGIDDGRPDVATLYIVNHGT